MAPNVMKKRVNSSFCTLTMSNVCFGSKADIRAICDGHQSFPRAYRSPMSTKHVDPAADLVRYGCSLKVECTGCGAARTMSGVEVVRRCGPRDLQDIRSRAKVRALRDEGGSVGGIAAGLDSAANS